MKTWQFYWLQATIYIAAYLANPADTLPALFLLFAGSVTFILAAFAYVEHRAFMAKCPPAPPPPMRGAPTNNEPL